MNPIKHISLLLAAMFAVNFAWAQIDTVCVLDPNGGTYGLYSVDTDEQGGQGSVNAFYDWNVYLSDGVTEVPQAVITTQQGAEGSTNQIQVDWSNVTPGNYVVSVVETDTLTTCVGQPVSINVTVVDAIQPDVSCTSTTIDQVDFTWNSLTGATSFTIEEFVNGVTTNQVADYVATDYSVVGLSAGDSVTLIVTPIGSAEACFIPDTASCSTIPCDITAIQVSTTATTCGLDNGELQVVNVIGGTAPFTYSIDGVNYDVVTGFTNLPAGNVEVFVIDANECLFSQTFTVGATPNSLVASASLLTPLSCQDSVVFISVTASDGAAPYVGTGLQEVTEPGDYSYTVTDDDGCAATTNVVVVAPPAEGPTLTVDVNGLLTCLITTVPVTVTATGGTQPYSGQVGTFNEVAGTFTYTVTDANGCEVVSDPITIAEAIEGPTASIDTLSGGTVGCGQEQVELTVSASGGLAPYTNTGTYNVGAGFWSYTVTDANNCPSTVSITIGGDTNPPTSSIVASGLNLSCTDSVVTLTSQFPATQYQWLDQNDNVISTASSVEVTQGGLYTLIVTAANNCTAEDQVTITQDADVPSFDLTSINTELNCDITSITIEAINISPVGGSFTWSNGAANVNQIDVSTADTYTATYLAPNGCEVSQSLVISQDTASVVVTIIPTATELTCDVEQITLTASGADNYEWSTGETGPSIVIDAAGPYSVTGTTTNGCEDVDQEIITIDTIRPTPAINASDLTLTCDVQSITLIASGGVAYDWGFGPSPVATLDVSSAGYYTVEVIADNGCSDTTGIGISQEDGAPEISVVPSADPLTCATDTIILTASGALTYTWNGGLSVGATLIVTEPGVYTVIGVDANGCGGIGSYTVSQDTISPFVEIINLSQNDTLTCDSISVQVQAQGADTYEWSGGLGANAFALITQAGTYQATGTNASNGCSATAEITIGSDGNLPEVTINNLTGTFELGCDTVQIDIEVVTNIVNGEFVWTNGLPSSANQSITSADTYTVTVTDPETGCVGQNSITITQDVSLPVIEVFNTTGTDSITCNLVPQEIALFATGGVEYQWQDGFENVLSNSANVMVTQEGDYEVTVTGDNGCTDFFTYSVYENLTLPEIQISASYDTITCARPSIVLTASGASTYNWSTSAAGASITVSAADTYEVIGTGTNGCENSALYTIEIDTVSPGASIVSTLNVLTCQDSVAVLTASGNGSFDWNNGFSNESSISVEDPGLYVLEVTGFNGCISTDQLTLNEDVVAPIAVITPGGGVLTCQVESILLTASGGVSYEWFDGSIDAILSANAAGDYTVTVTGANGCTDDAMVTITQSADLPVVSVVAQDDTLNCNVSTTLLTAGVVVGSVNYTWTDANNVVVGNAATLLVNQPGVYTATALDVDGCEGSAIVEIVGDFAVPVAEIINVTGPTELTCVVQSITLEATGGVSYAWNFGLGIDPVVNITAPQNNYEVVVTGLNGCDTTLSYAITQNIALPAVAINNLSGTSELTCEVDSISVQAINGFIYEWNNGLGFGPQQWISSPGTYQVIATGENGCRDSVDIAIQQDIAAPVISVANLAGSNQLTCALNTINITALGTGEFVWSDASGNNLSNTADLAITQPGDYTLTVTGDNGCISDSVFTFTQDIAPPSLAIVNVTNATVITCATDSIQLNVNTDAVSFDWTPAIFGSASTIFVTQAGDYSVTAIGANGCDTTATITISQDTTLPGAVIATSSATNTLTCAEDVITLIPDGAGSYAWSGGGTEVGVNLEVVDSGFYTLTVTGDNGCVSQAVVQIFENVTQPNAQVVNLPSTSIITCTDETIELTASGASTYAWYDAIGSQLGALDVLTVDAAGTYTVIATASNGCEDTLDVVITENVVAPTMSIANASGSQVLNCSLVTIQLTASGATEYAWTNSAGAVVSSIADLTVTAPDTYIITGIAANGCQDTAQIVIGQDITDPLVSISNLVGSTTLTCSLDSIVLLAQGNGVSYSWSDGTSVLSNSALLQVEIAGVYEVTAIGSNGCDSIATISILSDGSTPLADIDLPLLNDTLTCDVTSIELVASGGSSYAWSNGLGNGASVFVTIQGSYTVTVTSDATGCSAEATIDIFSNTTAPSVSIENITQEDTITCAVPSIALQASGAEDYSWVFNGSTLQGVSVTSADVYQVIGTGSNGCSASAFYEIYEDIVVPLVFISNPSNNLQLTCDSTDIDVVAQGASTYSWSDQNGVVGNGAAYIIDAPGFYTVTGSLSNGCSSTASITVTENVELPIASITNNTGGETQLTCDLDTISLTATGGVQYSWSNGVSVVSSDADFIAGTPGTFVVTVTALNGCTDTASVIITSDGSAPIAEITIPSGIDTLTCLNQSTTIVASGPYTFEWSDGSTLPSLTVNEAGVYTLTVTAANGCSASSSVTIAADTLAPVIFIDNPLGLDELTCDVTSIAVSASGGVSYEWSNASTVVSNVAALNIVSPGVYTVLGTGINGCVNTASITISQDIADPAVSIINPEEGSVLTCDVTEIVLSAAGADAYTWTDASLNVLGNLDSLVVVAPGSYTVTGINANGCDATATFVITQNILLPTAAITNSDAPATTLTCTLNQIDLTASGGVAYSWSNGTAVVSNDAQLAVTAPATYTVTVTGSNGCVDTEFITIGTDGSTPSLQLISSNSTLTCSVPSITLNAIGLGSLVWSVEAPAGSDCEVAGDPSIICTTEFIPVCGCNGITYGNACEAERDGVFYYVPGECGTPGASAVTISTPGTYTVTLTASNGCTTSQAVVISEDVAPPALTITSDSPSDELTCADALIQLTANTTGTVVWNNNLPASSVVNVSTGADYIATATSANGCVASDTLTISQDITAPELVLDTLNNTSVLTCLTTSIQMSASGASDYAWSNALNQVVSSQSAFNPSTPGTYQLTGTGANGCEADLTVIVTQDTISPVVSIVSDDADNQLTCADNSITLTASGADSYVWSSSSPEESITVGVAATYTVTGTDATNGCTDQQSVVVTSDGQLPVVTITALNDTLNCLITQTTLTADTTANALPVTIAWSNGLGSASAVTVNAEDTYNVTVTAANGCSAQSSIFIAEDLDPVNATIINNTGTTQLSSTVTAINVTATGGVSYQWSNGLGTNPTVNLTSPGVYSVIVTGDNGCAAFDTINISNALCTPPIVSIVNVLGDDTLTCALTEIQVSAQGADSYSWNNGLGNMATATITAPGTYIVTGTNADGCSATDTITIAQDIVAPNASIFNNSPTAILTCNQNSVSVTALGGVSYSWSNGLGNNADATITSAGNYLVTVTAMNGCTDTTSITITDDGSLPQPTITSSLASNQLTCTNATITLTAGGVGNYAWTSNGQNLGASQTLVVTSPGTYTLTLTNTNGCVASASVDISIDIAVNASITADAPFIDCNNLDVILTATGGVSYVWSNNLGVLSTATVNTGGQYSVTATAANGCEDIAFFDVAANFNLPNVTIDNNTGTTILGCNTNSISLTADGAVSYSWNNNLGSQASVTVLSPGEYIVFGTGNNGCVNSDTLTITQDNTLPVASIASNVSTNTITCAQPSIVLTASGNGTIVWADGQTDASITVTEGGEYSVTVTAANGCTDTETITITEDLNLPTAVIVNSTNNTVLSCAITAIEVTATGGGAYSWSDGLGSNAAVSLTQPGDYTVTVTATNGCVDSETIVITTDGSLPQISLEASADELNCFTNEIVLNVVGGTDSIVWSIDGADCPGIPNTDLNCVDLSDPVCGCDGVTYNNACYAERDGGVLYYLPGECGSTNGQSSITVSNPGVYTVTVVNANGCSATDTYTIEENLEVPEVLVFGNSPICSTDNAEFVVTGTAGDVVNYSLDGGVTPQSATIEADGSVTITVVQPTTDQQLQIVSVERGSCVNNTSLVQNIVVNETPVANAIGPLFSLCEGSVLSLNASIVENASYTWTGPSGFSSDQTPPVPIIIPNVDPADAGDYVLQVAVGSCVDFDTVSVVVASPTAAEQFIQICIGQTFTLPNDSIVSDSGTYIVTIDNANACDSVVTTYVEVVTAFNVNQTIEVCEGETATMPDGSSVTAEGEYVFNFQSSGGCDSIITVDVIVHPNYYFLSEESICAGASFVLVNGQVVQTEGLYEVAFQTIHGCDSIYAVQLTVLDVPTPTAVALSLCPGQTITLSDNQLVNANGEYSVVFDAFNGCDSVVVYTATYYENYSDTVEVVICNNDVFELPNGQLATETNNYLIYDEQSIHGCDSSLVYVVTELPAIANTFQVNLCYNEVFTTPDGGIVGSNGDYSFNLTSSQGCDSLVTFQIAVGEQIQGEPQQQFVCFGETAVLPDGNEVSVSGEYVSILGAVNGCDSLIVTNVVAFPFLFTEYSDYACQGTPYILPDGSEATIDGIYPIQLTSQFGCDSIVQVTVDFTPMVMVSIIPEADSLELCQGDTLMLIADGAFTYTWESVAGVLLTTEGAIVDLAPMEDAWVSVTGTGLACSARDSIYLTVNPAPALEIVAPTAICMGDSVTLSAGGADSLFWMPNEFISCLDCDEITVSPAQSTVFTLSGYNGQCFGTTSLAMEVQEVPVSEVYGDTLVCAYSPAELFVIGGTTYVWSTGDTASAISVAPGETTVYTVVAISGICSDTSFITVEAIPLPQIEAGNDTLITLGGEVQLNATGGINYVWSPATDLSCTTCANPLAIPSESITYCVEGIAESGCADTSCLRIEVTDECETFFIPNAFAPEAGGHELNDCFRVFGEECFGSMRIRIFDRWGELVYESTEFGDCWDGSYQGKKVNTGVFVYYFDGVLLNGEPFYRKGNVTVIR